MNLQEFEESLNREESPSGMSLLATALWFDKKENWGRAHEIVQDAAGADAALVHAYLHRKEGDLWNADYWYTKAGQKRPAGTLDDEWLNLVKRYLNK